MKQASKGPHKVDEKKVASKAILRLSMHSGHDLIMMDWESLCMNLLWGENCSEKYERRHRIRKTKKPNLPVLNFLKLFSKSPSSCALTLTHQENKIVDLA